jgi:ABC-type multidrug transport system fused ATPase/permease subunit
MFGAFTVMFIILIVFFILTLVFFFLFIKEKVNCNRYAEKSNEYRKLYYDSVQGQDYYSVSSIALESRIIEQLSSWLDESYGENFFNDHRYEGESWKHAAIRKVNEDV